MAQKNTNLKAAKKNKNDEFYTLYDDINAELRHYVKHFKDKVVFCNCDDPESSNFWKFFVQNFRNYEIKKVISTHFNQDGSPSYKLEYDGQELNGQQVWLKTPLHGDGDFRSEECVELLKQADIVVTNPPFSLFRAYVAQLMEYKKKFLIIGNINAVTYKEFFPLLKDNKVWAGFSFNKTMSFTMPEHYQGKNRDANGRKIAKVPAVAWYTNLDIEKRHELLLKPNEAHYKYYGHEEDYPKYDNYDAINVDKVAQIPDDYMPCWFNCNKASTCEYALKEGFAPDAACELKSNGAMGVPITFFDKHNPDEFIILGMCASAGYDARIVGIARTAEGDARPLINGKTTYARIFDERCNGIMGVPITYLDKHNPNEFEILGMSATADTMTTPVQLGESFISKYREQGGTGHFSANMYGVCYFDNNGKAKVPYGRILIRRKKRNYYAN